MSRFHSVVWWYWLFTALALGASLAGSPGGAAPALALTVVQAVHLAVRAGSLLALSVQVRAAYLGLLVVGAWLFPTVHVLQLAGTTILLVFDYCPLARMLSLMPWNRRGPLTLARLRATFLLPPVSGSIAAALDRGTF